MEEASLGRRARCPSALAALLPLSPRKLGRPGWPRTRLRSRRTGLRRLRRASDLDGKIPPVFAAREMIIHMTFGVVVLSIIAQALTVGPLLRALGITGEAAEPAR